MNDLLKPVKPQKAYELVIDQISNMIIEGDLKKGQKLIPERDLAAQLQVSRPTVRESLRALEVIGLIESRHGEGHFIKENFIEGLVRPLSLVFVLEESKFEDILELRKMIEGKTASLAAKNRTEEDIKKLKDIIHELDLVMCEEDLNLLDNKFHSLIADISRNNLVISVYNAMSDLLDSFIINIHAKGLAKFLTVESSKESILLQHRQIVKAIKAGNEKESTKRMLEHLEFVEII